MHHALQLFPKLSFEALIDRIAKLGSSHDVNAFIAEERERQLMSRVEYHRGLRGDDNGAGRDDYIVDSERVASKRNRRRDDLADDGGDERNACAEGDDIRDEFDPDDEGELMALLDEQQQ